jgi:hypothetical protein
MRSCDAVHRALRDCEVEQHRGKTADRYGNERKRSERGREM